MPKVSFVLPAYKRRFLKEAISSILAQTFADIELIVVDDHSPENLKEIVDEFSDVRLSYHYNEHNLGGTDLVHAWEKAMSYATGEWCVLASDDDVYLPRYTEEMLKLVQSYPNVNVVHSRVVSIDGNGRWLEFSQLRKPFESAVEYLYSRAILRYRQTMPDFMFRRSALAKAGGFVHFPVAWHSDDATWMALAMDAGVAYTDEVLFCFRMSGINISDMPKYGKEKTEATYRYASWVREKIPCLHPKSEEEKVMLALVSEQIESAHLTFAKGILDPYPLSAWWKVYRDADVPRSWKKELVKSRLVHIVDTRRMIKDLLRLMKGVV